MKVEGHGGRERSGGEKTLVRKWKKSFAWLQERREGRGEFGERSKEACKV